jgi:hypothetical protein
LSGADMFPDRGDGTGIFREMFPRVITLTRFALPILRANHQHNRHSAQ